MTNLQSTKSSATALIPLRRFAAHFILSALATAIPQLLQHLAYAHPWLQKTIASLSWSAIVTGGFVIHTLRVARYRSRTAFFPDCTYGMAASLLIAALHNITKVLGKCVGGTDTGFTARQHNAVHLYLVFYAITELEFYRAYILFEGFDTYIDCLKYLPIANINPVFPYHREPICYMMNMPDSWRRYLDGDRYSKMFSKSHKVIYASHVLFYVVCGVSNYFTKRMVNPDPKYDYRSAMTNGSVLFGTSSASVGEVLLAMALSRIVRQANYVGFWAVVGQVERWMKRRQMGGSQSELM
jgi:hypothetical protein